MRSRYVHLLATCGVLAGIGCGGDDIQAPATGSLAITTATTGAEPDPDGYRVSIDDGAGADIGSNGSLEQADLEAGDHTVELSGIASNCTVSGNNPQTVSITAGETTNVTISVTCGVSTGSLEVTAATTGSALDPDGFSLSVDGADRGPLGINASATLENLPAGDHQVGLNGIAANCQVQGDNPRSATISAGAATSVTFNVSCAATAGSIEVTTRTTGSNLDADGYQLALDNAAPQPIAINTTSTLSGLPAGGHTVELSGLADNCQLTGSNRRSVAVTAGASASVTFAVTCAAPTPTPAASLIAFNSNAVGLMGIFVVKPDGTGLKNLTANGALESNPVWSPDARKILFSKDDDLYVMNADGTGRKKLADGQGIFVHRWSRDGNMIAYVASRIEGQDIFDDLWVMRSDGTGKRKLAEEASEPTWSADGRRIAYVSSKNLDIAIRAINVDGTNDVRLTDEATPAFQPAWSPDGTRIAFVTLGDKQIMLMNPDGTGVVNLTNGQSEDDAPSWSPDSRKILFSAGPLGQPLESEVAVMDRDGRNRVTLTNHPGFDYGGDWSSDGSKIVYVRSDPGDSEIYVMNPDGTGQLNVSNRPGTLDTAPDWNGQGGQTSVASSGLQSRLRRLLAR